MTRHLIAALSCLALAAPVAAQAPGIAVGGEVPRPYVMTAQVYATLDIQDVAADNGDGMHWYRAVPLCGVLEQAGVVFGNALQGAAMAAYVLIEGADGYRVVLPLASLDDSFGGGVFIARAMDGSLLSADEGPYRLILPADTRTTRWVERVVKVTVQSPPGAG